MREYKLETIIFICMGLYIFSSSKSIDEVDDTDLIHLLSGKDNVVALFTSTKCLDCNKWETVLETIQNELKTELEAEVVRIRDSHLLPIYDPNNKGEAALLFFRKGIPLLYDGEINAEEILFSFSSNKEPIVKELSDINFEHLTQASTGATTGDWLLFFYSSDCVLCQRLYAVWEAVGSKLKHRLTVARINRLEGGLSTAKRLGVEKSLEFILLHQGKAYRYRSTDYKIKSFVEFAENGYKQTPAEDIPQIPSPLNDYVTKFYEQYYSSTTLMWAALFLAFLCVVSIIIKLAFTRNKAAQAKSKSK